ncbi:hypothetical protein [Nocardia sp. CNY236]|uniref:hypothetical protein n=1 Tax=Nocardia sp. CNY236 TaxID=1169152 RepID=UPI00048A948E|nr:hypothetical protein [Nocardia sp. CNY236]
MLYGVVVVIVVVLLVGSAVAMVWDPFRDEELGEVDLDGVRRDTTSAAHASHSGVDWPRKEMMLKDSR